MTVADAAAAHCKKVIKFGVSLFSRGFNSSKCKTMTKMVVARIKLLRNKRQVVVKQMRRDIAMLLDSGQDATARIRVEHVIREQNVLAANEFIELFCELVVARLSIIAKQRECPADLKEGISSLIFAGPRCSDIPELLAIQDIFVKKYGKDFVSAATDLRPNCGVNRMLIDKLSVRTPSGELKLKVLKEIAKEYQVDWDTTESELELLKPPEELIDGPKTFVTATSLPIKHIPKQSVEPIIPPTARYSDIGERRRNTMHFEDTASAAEAAAESAKQAIAAAGAAAYLANRDCFSGSHDSLSGSSSHGDVNPISGGNKFTPHRETPNSERSRYYLQGKESMPKDNMDTQKTYRRHSYNVAPPAHLDDESEYDEEIEVEEDSRKRADLDSRKMYRRHSYNVQSKGAGIKFDESDGEDDFEKEEEPARGTNLPPNKPPPPPAVPSANSIHRVHPKLPDYDALAARFEDLKYRKSKPGSK